MAGLKPIKDGTKIISNPRPVNLSERPVVQASLGCIARGAAMPHPDPKDPETTIAGVRKRFAFKPPKPCPVRLRKLKRFAEKWCKKNLRPLSPDADLSFETWLEKTKYTKARKEELKRVWYDPNSRDDDKVEFCKSFMKDETYPEYKHARAINSRSDWWKCYMGPCIKAIEEELYKHPSFIKHVPVSDRPRYIRDMLYRVGSTYVATDYTAFESLFTADVMKALDFVLLRHMLQFVNDGASLIDRIEKVTAGLNHCEFHNFVVEIVATRMSGEMSTSLFNGFANLMLMLFVCDEIGTKCEGVVEGDDGLFRLNGPIPTTETFADLGFVVKMEVHNDICSASFCGIIFDEDDLINVTDPREVLAGFGWTTRRYARSNHRTKALLLRCKALSYAHQYPGCPIIDKLSKYGLRVTRSYDVREFIKQRWATNQWEREQLLDVITKNVPQVATGMNTRFLVEKKYNIPVETQIQIETYLDSLSDLQFLDIPQFDLMVHGSWLHYWENYVVIGSLAGDEQLNGWVSRADHVREW